jgi:hypothetical protein
MNEYNSQWVYYYIQLNEYNIPKCQIKNWHVGSEKQFHNINGFFAWIINTMLYGIQQG